MKKHLALVTEDAVVKLAQFSLLVQSTQDLGLRGSVAPTQCSGLNRSE